MTTTAPKPDPAALYEALTRTKSGHTARRLTYRCALRGCLLFDAVEARSVGDILVHEARHKYSPQRSESNTAAEARKTKTEDGDRRWPGRSYWVAGSGLSWRGSHGTSKWGSVQTGVNLRCDHVDTSVLTDDFWADWEAGHAEIKVKSDGHKYAVYTR